MVNRPLTPGLHMTPTLDYGVKVLLGLATTTLWAVAASAKKIKKCIHWPNRFLHRWRDCVTYTLDKRLPEVLLSPRNRIDLFEER